VFADAAREYSKGLHAGDGGCWGLISEPCREYWEEPSRVALSMSADTMSEVRENDHCVYIVRVGTVEEARTVSFEEAQPGIALKIRGERTAALEREFLQSLVERSTMGEVDPFVEAVVLDAPEWKRIRRSNQPASGGDDSTAVLPRP